jgi:thiol-disulfide isomerase/thioredoxin
MAIGVASALAQPPEFVGDRFYRWALLGQPVPHVVLHSPSGDSLALDSLHGHPVLILYWATWCGNCKAGVASLAGLRHDLPQDTVILGVDFDRDPSAATAYLQQSGIALRDFHDDTHFRDPESLHVKLHLHAQPYPMSILLDAEGRVVYCENSMFREELHAAFALLAPQVTLLIPGMDGSPDRPIAEAPPARATMPVAELRALGLKAMAQQSAFLEGQKEYRCRYTVTTRDDYGSGRSQHKVEQVEEVFSPDGRQLTSTLIESDSLDPAPPATKTIAIWSHPVLGEILAHSILSNIVVSRSTAPAGTPRQYVTFTVRGDPAFTPHTDEERTAQALEGRMTIDITDTIFTAIDAVIAYDLTDGSRLLYLHDMPVFSFHATPFEGVPLPSEWSLTVVSPVPLGPNQARLWTDTLQRTFALRQSCTRYHVDFQILPPDAVPPAAPSEK